jgi:membrane-anchored protein YejM (alkaline phosphatase superfamily)
MPYTHGLPGSVLLSLVFGVIIALVTSGNRVTTILLVAAASFSHWILDLVVHVHDLPLYDNSAKIGFGLWRHVVLSFPLELIVLGLGAWLYARTTTFARAKGRFVFWAFVVFLAMLQVYANFGPPPSSPEAMAVSALAFYLVLALLAAWVERMAIVSTDVKPAR